MLRVIDCLYCGREIPDHMSCNCPKSMTVTYTACMECDTLKDRNALLEDVVEAAGYKSSDAPLLIESCLACGKDHDKPCHACLLAANEWVEDVKSALNRLEGAE